MKKIKFLFVIVLIVATFVGCAGMSQTEKRTLGGAAIGAGAGAGIAGLAGGNAWVGAGVGAAAGALTGYMTSD